MALRAFHTNPSLGGFGSENAGAVVPPPSRFGDDFSTGGRSGRRLSSSGRRKNNIPSAHSSSSLDGPNNTNNHRQKAVTAAAAAGAGGGDAFAQIAKELVDNAVDACCAGTSNGTGGRVMVVDDQQHNDDDGNGKPIVLKRVRVVIEPVDNGSGTECHTSQGYNNDENGDDGNEMEASPATNSGCAPYLRVSVNDNGTGMGSIEACVEAFRTSKRADASQESMSQSQGNGDNDLVEKHTEHQGDEQQQQRQLTRQSESQTAGRYGIGLTLCLLHSQRLCPNSVASITSATADSIQWTRASYVVDTEGDRVKCVKKEMLPKTRSDESGTVVSLLVPGGAGAAVVWPRLAEYFARFQLSSMTCSLEVKAPTLSTIPLYIRPTFEVERRQKKLNEKLKQRQHEDETRQQGRLGQRGNDTMGALDDESVASGHGERTNENQPNDDNGDEWDDGLTVDGSRQGSRDLIDNEEEETSVDATRAASPALSQGSSVDEEDDDASKDTSIVPSMSEEEKRRKAIQRAASSYLNQHVELMNVAHSVNPIRRRTGDSEGDRASTNATLKEYDRPMLEVDMVVYGRDYQPSDDEVNSEGSPYNGDEFETMFAGRNESHDESGEAAKLILIRMVNNIPLLDGAEGSSCGLVRGLSSKKTIWNSYGLEISPLIEDSVPSALDGDDDVKNDIDAYIPSYHVRDSAQVAPFFRTHSHALYETDSEDEYESDEEASDCLSDCSSDEETNVRTKRKRKKMTKLLPARLRLGNVLLIAQIHANPSALPLPTLSKGRLPMNDAGIDDALELGLSSCLRSLQRSNPELLLTANQLKRTERDVRYLPAIAVSLSSIIKNSSNAALRSDVYGKVMSWEAKATVAAPIIEGIESNSEGNAKAVGDEDKSDDESMCSRSSVGSENVLNQTMDNLSAMRLATLIENQLRYCISDENKQRKKEEERERKLEARRQEQAKKRKKKKKTKNGSEGKEKSGDAFDGDDSNIDLDDLLLEGTTTADDEDMESSQQSDDTSTSSDEARSDDDSDADNSSTQNGRHDSKCSEDGDFSEEDVFLPSSIVTPAPTSTERENGQMANEAEGEEKKDDGFDEEDDWW